MHFVPSPFPEAPSPFDFSQGADVGRLRVRPRRGMGAAAGRSDRRLLTSCARRRRSSALDVAPRARAQNERTWRATRSATPSREGVRPAADQTTERIRSELPVGSGGSVMSEAVRSV